MENELISIPCEVIPVEDTIEQLQKRNCTEFPVSELPSLGIIGNEMLNFYNACIIPGGEGLYRVTFPQGVTGSLSKFKTENAYLGSIRNGTGFSQARLTQISINPEQLLMALALMSINSQLSSIMETQTKMLNFMYDVEESKLSAGKKELDDTFKEYKINWNNAGYNQQGLSVAKDKKADAQKALELYKKQIETILQTPNYLHIVKKANNKISDLIRFLSDVYTAYYLLGYATFLECLLMRNFTTANIENLKDKIKNYSDEYAALYERCTIWMQNYLTSAVDYKIAPVLRGMDYFYASLLSKAPFDADKLYENDGQYYVSLDEQEQKIAQYQQLRLNGFEESIESIRLFYNEKSEIYIDSQKIYLLNEPIEE